MLRVTREETELLKSGVLKADDIEAYRKDHPVQEVPIECTAELLKVKQELRDLSVLYKEAIQKNKDLYKEIVVNRNLKAELRQKIGDVRKAKKELSGRI